MTRAVAAALAVVGLVGGCGWGAGAERPPPEKAAALPERAARKTVKRVAQVRVAVTVIDGDTRRPVGGALVRVGRRRAWAGRNGKAAVRLRRLAPLVVRVVKSGYAAREVRMPFHRRRAVAVRIYRPGLQWTMYGATPARTQANSRIRLRPPFRVVWSRGLGDLIEFPAVVSGGVAYIGNSHGVVRAISMRNGRVAWRWDMPRGKMAASPAVVGRDLVVHGMEGGVWVLDRRNGRPRWSYRIGSPIESSPVVRHGIDYFGAWDGRVYALDLRVRRLRWTYPSGYKITASAALAGGTVYIGNYGGRLLALTAGTGRLRWTGAVNGRIYGAAAVAAERVFVPSSTGASLTAFSTGGRHLWRVYGGSYVYSSPAVWAGRVVFGSYDGRLRCVDARSGRLLWSVQTGGPVSGAAVVVGGVAYAGSFANRIVGVELSSGRVLLRFPHGQYVPVSGSGGRLLLHGYSRLYAVEPAA